MTNITIRWAGPSDATSGSTYKIERTIDNATWTVLAATQAAKSPYVSETATLASNAVYGATTISLTSTSLNGFASSGYLWLDDALVQWTDKNINDLTGCVWHSGYGTYAIGSTVYEAHESYADTPGSFALYAVLYRITHTEAGGTASAPTYIWYYDPPQPESSDHCVVIVNVKTDLGIASRSSVDVQAYLAADTSFGDLYGAHLDAEQSSAKTQATNVFGLAFFQCWKSSKRSPISGSDAAYTFVLDSSDATYKLTSTATTIPDRDWVLLSQIVTS